MGYKLTENALCGQNRRYRGTGGVSQENHGHGFRPAFLDTETGAIYRSCYADGRPAPLHLLDGLPQSLVLTRASCGRVTEVKAPVIAGFALGGRFYTRDEAARHVTAAAQAA